MQESEDEIEPPISYHSKKYNKYQRNYATVEKGTLALLLGSDHFIIGAGGWKTFFSRLFYAVDAKAGFFFTHHLKPVLLKIRFNFQSWGEFFFHFQGWGEIVLVFFCNISKQTKTFSNIQAGPNFFFFSQKQRQTTFSKSLPAPPLIMKWSVPYL